MSPAERLQEIITALHRAHSLSRAIDFMVTGECVDDSIGGSTFKASIEEVNECMHEAIETAVEEAETLQREITKGGA